MLRPLGHVVDVLVQAASQGDVQHLHAAADAEQWHPSVHRPPGQVQLEQITAGIGIADGIGHLLSVVLGQDVAPTGEEQAVAYVQHIVQPTRHPRQDHRDAACGDDRAMKSDGQIVAEFVESDRHSDHRFGAGHRRIMTGMHTYFKSFYADP